MRAMQVAADAITVDSEWIDKAGEQREKLKTLLGCHVDGKKQLGAVELLEQSIARTMVLDLARTKELKQQVSKQGLAQHVKAPG